MTDIEFGVRHLLNQEKIDAGKICIVGWSFGGYAALMGAIEFPERYKCVVSIAGVTSPIKLFSQARGERMRRYRKAQISLVPEEVQAASAVKRAGEIKAPVLLIHGEKDINVDFDHSKDMQRALKRAKKPVEFVRYKNQDHNIDKQKERIDMLNKIGEFLAEHLARGQAPASN